jgi:hypothetical protein
MKLSELSVANDLLHDYEALTARFTQDGCLLVRDAVDPTSLAAITNQATSALERYELAKQRDGIRWTGMAAPHLDETGINDIPALDDLVKMIDHGSDFLRPVADRVCGHQMHVWRAMSIFCSIPDDPAHVTWPHQDNFAMTTTGDYRRLWIALTEIPFGDAGLGLALGSHHRGRFPSQQLPDFITRTAPGHSSPPPATGIDPHLVDDHWHTAGMRPGDLIAFHSDMVHRGLPSTSDRIRLALGVIVSATSDPRPPNIYTGPENRARHKRVRELATPLGLSEDEVFSIAADLMRAGVTLDEHTVRAAARGDYARN